MADTPDLEVVSKKSLLERLTLPHGSYSTGKYIISDNGSAEEDSGLPMEVEDAPLDAHSSQSSQPLTFASFKFSTSLSASSKDAPSLLQRMRTLPLIEPAVPPRPSTAADRPDEEKRDIGDSEPCPEDNAPPGETSLPSDNSTPNLLHRISPNVPELFEPQSRQSEDPPVVHQPLPDHNPDVPVSQEALPISSIIASDPSTQNGGGEASNPVSPVSIGKEKSLERIITPPPDDSPASVEESTHTEPEPGAWDNIHLVRPNFFAPTFQEILSTMSQEEIHAISASFEKPKPVMHTSHDSGSKENEVLRGFETAYGPSAFEDLFTEIAIEQSEWNGLRSIGATSSSQNANLEDRGRSTTQSEDYVEHSLAVDAEAPPLEQCATGTSSDAEFQQITGLNTSPAPNPDHENLVADNTSVPVAQDTCSSNTLPTSVIQIPPIVADHNSGPLSSPRVLASSARRKFIPLKPMNMAALASLPPSRPPAGPSGEQFEWVSTSRPIVTAELLPLPMAVWPHFTRRPDEFESQELSKAVTITRATLYGSKPEVSRHNPPSPGSGNPPAKRRRLFLSSRSPSSSPSIPLMESFESSSVSPVKIEQQADDMLLNKGRTVSQDLKRPEVSDGTRGVHSRGVIPLRKKGGSPWPTGSRADKDYLDGLREAEALTNSIRTESVVDRWVVVGSEGSLGDEDAEGSTEEETYDELAEDKINPIVLSIPPAQTTATIRSTSKPSQSDIDILTVAPLGSVTTVPQRATSTDNIAGGVPRDPITRKLVPEMSSHSTTPSGSTLLSNHVEPSDRNRKRSWVPPDPGADVANKRIKTTDTIELGDHQSSTQTDAKVQEDLLQLVSDVSPSESIAPSLDSSPDPIAMAPFGSSTQSRSEDEPSRDRSVITSDSPAYRGSYRPRNQRIVDSYIPRHPYNGHRHSQSGSQRHNSQPYRRSRSPRGESSRKTTSHARLPQTTEVSRRARTPPLPRTPPLARTPPMPITTSRATDREHSYLDRHYVPSRQSYSPPRRRSPLASRRSRSPIRNSSRNLRRASPARSQDMMNSVHNTRRSEEGNRKTLRRSPTSLPRDRDPSGDDAGIDSSHHPLRNRSTSPESINQKDRPDPSAPIALPQIPHIESLSESPLVGRDSISLQALNSSSATSGPIHSNVRDDRVFDQVSPAIQMDRGRLSPMHRDELSMIEAILPPAKPLVKPPKAITLVERIQPAPSRASTSASASPALLDRMRQPLQSSPPPTPPPYQPNNRSAPASANEPSLWQRMNDVPPSRRSAANPSQALHDPHRGQGVGPPHGVTYQPEPRHSSSQSQGSALINRIGLSPPVIRGRGRGRGTGRGGE